MASVKFATPIARRRTALVADAPMICSRSYATDRRHLRRGIPGLPTFVLRGWFVQADSLRKVSTGTLPPANPTDADRPTVEGR